MACGFIPAGHGYLVYAVWPLLGGPSFALTGFAPDLLAKLVPADVQGTFTTAKSFLFRLSQAIFMWPWNQLFMHTAHLAYPLDATALWVSLVLGVFMLMLTCYACQHDPREAIKSGRALDAFMASQSLGAANLWVRGVKRAGRPQKQSRANRTIERQKHTPLSHNPGLQARCYTQRLKTSHVLGFWFPDPAHVL